MLNDRSTIHEFINLSKLLAFPGELTESTSIGKIKKFFLIYFLNSSFKIFIFQMLKNPMNLMLVSMLNWGIL
jgi:hypothetical protein